MNFHIPNQVTKMLLTTISVIVFTYLFWFLVIVGPRKLKCGLQFNGAWPVPFFGNLLLYILVKAEGEMIKLLNICILIVY